MRVIVWGINYSPELTGIAPFNTGLCDFLCERLHQVEMVTAFPYYPFWRKISGDGGRLYRTDDFDSVRVHRCWHYVPERATTVRRIWHELSFILTSFVRLLFLARPDVYVVVSPPLLLGPLASLLGWLKRRPYVFHVQDLQPDAAVGLGMMKPGLFTRLLYRVEAWSYRHATLVTGISDGMIRAFARKNVPAERRALFPNWVRWYGRNTEFLETEAERRERGRRFRAKFGIAEGAFLATYSGNLGKKQGLETLVLAAEILERKHEGESAPKLKELRGGAQIHRRMQVPTPNAQRSTLDSATGVLVLIVGDGATRRDIEQRVADGGLTNIRMMPLLIEADYHGMLAASDVSLILQAPGTGQFFFPSKLLSVLSQGSPVLSVADDDSELAKAVAEGGFGVNVLPGSPAKLAQALQTVCSDPILLRQLQANTRWVEQFSGSKVLSDFEARLQEVVQKSS